MAEKRGEGPGTGHIDGPIHTDTKAHTDVVGAHTDTKPAHVDGTPAHTDIHGAGALIPHMDVAPTPHVDGSVPHVDGNAHTDAPHTDTTVHADTQT